jgi:thymidylate kinase
LTITIALVGADGAGKTTVARRLVASGEPIPCRYLYMGQSIDSSNLPLPTSRLARSLKDRAKQSQQPSPSEPTRSSGRRSHPPWALRRLAGLVNRLGEASWRQLLAASYRLRGFAVVCDRHYLFEAATYRSPSEQPGSTRLARAEYWMMQHLFPKPDLVICLDVSADVLYERKGEASPRRLKKRREAILEQGSRLPNFVVVDAAQPLDQVLEDVRREIQRFSASSTEPRNRGLAGSRP